MIIYKANLLAFTKGDGRDENLREKLEEESSLTHLSQTHLPKSLFYTQRTPKEEEKKKTINM